MAIKSNTGTIDAQQGDCLNIAVRWTPDGQIINLAGFTAEAIIARAYSTVNHPPSSISIDTVNSTVNVKFETDVMQELDPDRQWFYQVRVADADGCKTTIAIGPLKVSQSLFNA